MCTLLKTIALFASLTRITLAADDILIADFETDTYAPWTATGEAFGRGPARAHCLGRCKWMGTTERGW